MKKTTLIFAIATLFIANSYAQVTTSRGGTTTTTTGTTTGTTTTSSKGADNQTKKDQVKDHMSGDAASQAKEMTDKLNEVVGLSSDQYQKALKVNLKYCNEKEDLKAKYGKTDNPDKTAMQSELSKYQDQRMSETKKLLTKDQQAKFEAKRQEVKNKGDKGDKGQMTKEDKKAKMENMTPEQQQQMKDKKQDKKDAKAGN